MRRLYKAIKVNGRKIDLHRYLIERHLGRKLKSNEVVHHKNGNTLDNSLDNLVVVSRSSHSREHMIGHEVSNKTKEKLRIATTKYNEKGSHSRKPIALLNDDGSIEKVYAKSDDVVCDGYNRVCVCKVCVGSLVHHRHRKFKHISIQEYEQFSGLPFFK